MEVICGDAPKILMKNNVMIQAKYSLTTIENRVFLLLLYKVQKSEENKSVYKITHEELKEVVKSKTDNTIKKLSSMLDSLKSKEICFLESRKDRRGVIWGKSNFISGYKYDTFEKSFYIEVPVMVKELCNTYLKTGYTPDNLAMMFTLRNSYAQRLYELIRRWSGTKSVINYSVEDLKIYFELQDQYDEYGNFKRRVIKPAVKELEEKKCFEIKLKEVKEGKRVESIDFIVKDLDKRKYFDKQDIINMQDIGKNENNDTQEMFEEENNTNEPQKEKKTLKIENKEFFIPDEELFNCGTKRLFKKHFMDYDFTLPHLNEAFEESVAITMERDGVEIIEMKSYKFFKGTLNNKIIEYEEEYKKDLEHKENMDKYW